MPSTGKFIDFKPAPTVYKDKTEYAAEGYWANSNLIRFINDGDVASVGGWIADEPTGYATKGIPRNAITTQDLTGKRRKFLGTTSKLLVSTDGTQSDVTPVDRTSGALTNPIATTNTQTTVTITHAAHSAAVGDYVIFTAASSPTVGGYNFLDKEFSIVSVIDPDRYTITIPTPATSNATGGGTVTITYLLPSGFLNNTALYGFGAGSYGTPGTGGVGGGYGDPRAAAAVAPMRKWSLVKWGEDVIASPRGGKVYFWDATTGDNTRATVISTLPNYNGIVRMSPNLRQLVLFGTVPYGDTLYDPLEIRWSNTEDYSDINPTTVGTTAGTFRIPGDGEIIAVAESKQEYIIITTTQVWSMYYVGGTDIFSFNKLADNVGCIGPDAVTTVDGVVYWWGFDGFYIFDGSVRRLECSVQNYAANDLSKGQKEKTFAGLINKYNEIIFFYQSVSSITGECDSYVKFNRKLGSWDVGLMDRCVWVDQGLFTNPTAYSPTSGTFVHETGTTANGASLDSYCESAFFDLDTGTEVLLVDQLVPDLVQTGDAYFTLTARGFARGPDTVKGPLTVTSSDKSIYTRIRGRQLKVKISSLTSSFLLGNTRIRIKPDGGR